MTMTDGELREVVDRRQAAAEIIDEQEAIKADCSVEIGTELALRGMSSLDVGPWQCQIVDQDRSTLDKLKLLEAGVDPEILEKCTVKTHTASVRVTRRRGFMPIAVNE